MDRRNFLSTLGSGIALSTLGCSRGISVGSPAPGTRQLSKVGIQLYTLRDDAAKDLEGTLRNIAAAGYKEVELLSGMKNFGMPPKQLRTLLDSLGLRAPSTHVGMNAFDNMTLEMDNAQTLGHDYIVLASLSDNPSLDDYRRAADKLNEAGRIARQRGLWVAFHDEPQDFKRIDGQVRYDVMVERLDPSVTRLQLDTGNAAVGGADPVDYMKKYADRYWLFHIKDAPSFGAEHDTELGKGVVNFREILSRIDRIDEKHLYVEQESYPGAAIDSVRRDYAYLASLKF